MKNKKIIIFGASGMLGICVTKYFQRKYLHEYEIVPLNRDVFDITLDREEKLWSLLSHELIDNPNSIIINCAGAIIQRKYNKEKLIRINSLFPHILQNMAERLNSKLIHITTDCVFSGNAGYRKEDDPHDTITFYGKSKSLGEPENACVIRTSIIGEELTNKLSLLEWVKSQKNKEIEGYLSEWNGVTTLQLAKFIDTIIQNDLYWKGTRHYFTTKKVSYLNTLTLTEDNTEHIVPESITKFQLANMINEIFNLNITVKSKEYKSYMTLSTKHQIVETPSLYDQLIELKDFNIYE